MTETRYLFMGVPDTDTRGAMNAVVKREGLDALLGSALFSPANWHQSLSDRYWLNHTPDLETRLRRVGARVSAQVVQLLLNRIVSRGAHWAFLAKGRPVGFTELLAAVRAALATEGFKDLSGHSPHATLSYRAPSAIGTVRINPPIPWVIDKIRLVKSVGSGLAYHYEQIEEWRLQRGPQLDLFRD